MPRRVLVVVVMFLVLVVLTNGGTGFSFAAGTPETPRSKSVQSEEQKKVFDAHEAYVRYPGFNWHFSRLAP